MAADQGEFQASQFQDHFRVGVGGVFRAHDACVREHAGEQVGRTRRMGNDEGDVAQGFGHDGSPAGEGKV